MNSDEVEHRLAPHKWPFFYGWIILAAGTVGVVTSAPGQTGGVSPFTESLLTALGLSRIDLSAAYMFGTIASSLLLTRVGKLYDRYGARLIGSLSGILLGIALVALSNCDRLAAAVIESFPSVDARTGAMLVATLCFFLLRFSGQGVLFMASMNMMAKWFDRHRGLATGLTGMIAAPAFSVCPMAFNRMIIDMGWRQTWQMLALVIGVGFTLFAWLFFRDNPESCGLKPDGPLANRSLGSRREGHGARVQFTLAEARRVPAFWIFSFGLCLFGFLMTGFSFHVASVFVNAGLTEAQGFSIFMPCAIVSLILRPFIGWLADRIPLKYLLMWLLMGTMTTAGAIAMLGPGWTLTLLVIGSGVSAATFGTLISVTWANFFGREHLGAISGLNTAIMVFSSALGPWMFGQSLRLTGSYTSITIASIIGGIILMFLANRVHDPQLATT